MLRASATQLSAGHEESTPRTNLVVVDTKLTEPGSKLLGTTLPFGGLGQCGIVVVEVASFEVVGFDGVPQDALVTAKLPIAIMTSKRLKVRTFINMGFDPTFDRARSPLRTSALRPVLYEWLNSSPPAPITGDLGRVVYHEHGLALFPQFFHDGPDVLGQLSESHCSSPRETQTSRRAW